MPTYDYHCDSCEHEFEHFQSIKDDPLKKCPECGKPKLRRLFGTGAAVVFKGSGFYQTDYRSDSYKKAAEKDTKSSDSSGDKSPGDTAAKTEKKDAAKGTTSGDAKSKSKKPKSD